MKKTNILLLTIATTALLTLLPTKSQAQDVEVYLDSTAQFIRGFGAANIVDWYGDDLTMEDVDKAYGTGQGQLGFNILRLRIAPNSNAWSNGNQVETAKKVHEMGGIVWAAPWNPPASMYDPDSEQRKVDPAKYDLYAEHLNDFVTYMEDNGVPMYGISIQNEPDYANDWTAWEPEDIVEFLRDYAPMIDSRIIAPESFQFRRSYSDPILNDSLAAAHTDIIGGHIYGGGIADYPLAREKRKEVWMTEHYTTSDRSANIWPDALEVGREIDQVMKANWNAYIWWQIKRYYSPIHDGVDVVDPGRDFVDRGRSGDITKRGWVMSQFSRFIRPGDYRVHSSGPFGRGYNNVLVSAYKDTSASKIVLVAVNAETSDREINVFLKDGSTSSFSRYITSEDQNVENIEDLEVSGGRFNTTLPANSITTFVSVDFLEVSNQREEELVPESFELKQNYPNPFNPTTTIQYSVPEFTDVRLNVYDVTGRLVKTLVHQGQSAGTYTVSFNATALATGVYFYKLQAGSYIQVKRMMLIK
jgi:glucuronoarabinoxylan endo-1,4-beta-xylanase